MKQLRYVGNNKPKNMIVEVEEKDVERLLDSGDYEKLTKTPVKNKVEAKNDNNDIKSTKRF